MKPLSSLPRLSLLLSAAACCVGLVTAGAPAATPTLALSAPPVLSGTAQVGQTLQVSTGTWSPAPSSYLYAWHRCNSAGTNCSLSPTSTLSSSYPLTAGDVGFRIVPQVAPDGQWALSVNTAPSAVVAAAPAPSGAAGEHGSARALGDGGSWSDAAGLDRDVVSRAVELPLRVAPL